VLLPPGAGEVIGDAADRRVEILSDAAPLHATWSRFGPGRDGADLHVHRRHTDVFYVLAGELTVRVGVEDEHVQVPAGTLVRVPPLVVHGFRNAGERELRYLNLHAPGEGFADYLRGIRDGRPVPFDQEEPPTEGVRPSSDAAIGGSKLVVERPGLRVTLLADEAELAVAEVWCEEGVTVPQGDGGNAGGEGFYVLDGELAVAAGGREVCGGAGAWVQVPAGVPHTATAVAEVRFLHVRAPGSGSGGLAA
jgi:mannose-6-phosphate isomerase-like protein (cupin superfamily)